jgi:hypothetical protein
MKLGLERCAELLVERDNEAKIEYIPFYPYNPTPTTPWYKHPYFIQECTTTCKKED